MCLLKKKVINSMILDGKKLRAFRLYGYLNVWLKESMGVDGWVVVEGALNNLRPLVGLSTIRIGGVRYRVPVPISFERSLGRSVCWLFRARVGFRRIDIVSVYHGILAGFFGRGFGVVRQREWYRLAARNRMYAKFLFR